MTMFEVKPETIEYKMCGATLFYRCGMIIDINALNELEQLIGIDPVNNITANCRVLEVANIPDGKKDQFKHVLSTEKYNTKNSFQQTYKAKVNSELNKKYLVFLKKYGLCDFIVSKEYLIPIPRNWPELAFICVNIMKAVVNPNNNNYRVFLKLEDDIPPEAFKYYQNNASFSEIQENDVEYRLLEQS